MSLVEEPPRPGSSLPDLDGPISAPGGQIGPTGRPGKGEWGIYMACVGQHWFLERKIKNLYRRFIGEGQPFRIRRPTQYRAAKSTVGRDVGLMVQQQRSALDLPHIDARQT